MALLHPHQVSSAPAGVVEVMEVVVMEAVVMVKVVVMEAVVMVTSTP